MIESGKKLFEEGRYEESFKVFKQIGQDENQLNSDRAGAYHMMGVLVNFSPGLSEYEDESGLEYYKMALQFDEDISTLLNITSSFGESPDMHQDIQVFKSAYDRLMDRKSELDAEELKILKKKYILMKKLEQGK
jgi:hypothetical protein